MRRPLLAALVSAALSLGSPLAQAPTWIDIDYGPLVDRRQLSHSGEAVGVVLRRLAERPDDPAALALLDPLLERYAYVMPDLLDLRRSPITPWFEIGALYPPGGSEPAWAELLRARRFLLESDGAGNIRAFVPATSSGDARAAWDQAWPVVRWPLAAERVRRAGQSGNNATLKVEVYAYRHLPQRTVFSLNPQPYRAELLDNQPRGDRPPVDVAAIEKFLATKLTLEGGRLTPNGTLSLFGSDGPTPMTLLGRTVTLADLAVAYRAVFHGGQAEPYMSLDRGNAPQTSVVNYGGRLRDTTLGLVSLLCDIRFKTFSLGFDPRLGGDARRAAQSKAASFQTHFERYATDPRSAAAPGQQTRLWFYPDSVDLTLSPQADLLALRRVRMSAASERLGGSTPEVAAWTKATVDAINTDYDALADAFPEMRDLDTVVRLLSLFTWLKTAEQEGLLLPDLDTLLAVPLPAEPTPRLYPQQLAFGAAPAAGDQSAPLIFDRLAVGAALDQLLPRDGGSLPAARRLTRALAHLDPRQPDHAALAKELAPLTSGSGDAAQLDDAAYRAERLRMHQLVLGTLSGAARQQVQAKIDGGAKLRVLSLGIGGLDLGMGQVVRRAQQRSVGLRPGAARVTATSATPTARIAVQETWKLAKSALPIAPLPPHGKNAAQTTAIGTRVLLAGDSSEARSRLLNTNPAGKIYAVERYEDQRFVRYAFDRLETNAVGTHLSDATSMTPPAPGIVVAPTAGMASLELFHDPVDTSEKPQVRVRLAASGGKNLEAPLPRALLERLVLGRDADLTPSKPLGALAPLPPALGDPKVLMVIDDERAVLPPWEVERPVLPGEEEPVTIARALNAWWAGDPATASLRAVVGVDRAASPARYAAAPRPDTKALLYAPTEAFPGATASWRAMFVDAWPASNVVTTLPKKAPSLVVLVSAEAPAQLGLRVRALSQDPALKGALLAVLSLNGSLRRDLPARWIGAGNLAGVGVYEGLPVGVPQLAGQIGALAKGLAATAAMNVERLPGPLLWYF